MRFGGVGRVGLLVALAAVAALSAIPSAASAATVADASCTVQLGFSVTPSPGDIKEAQTFTAGHTGVLVSAQVTVTNSAGSTPGDWRLEIAATDGSGLPGTILAATTVANALGDGQQGAITGSFANPAHVSAGTLYALLVSRPGSSKYGLAGEGGDPCPGQAYFQNAVGGPFLLYSSVDYGFATTVDLGGAATGARKCKRKKHHKRRHAKCHKKKHHHPLAASAY